MGWPQRSLQLLGLMALGLVSLWLPAAASLPPHQDAPACPGPAQPVIVYHSHARETYAPAPASAAASHLSIVTVGHRLAQRLRRHGVAVLHSRRRHDVPTEAAAYDRSRRTVAALLRRYPRASMVIDLHRDAPGRQETVGRNRAGETTARLLFVLGAHPLQQRNRELSLSLMQGVIAMEPDLNRGLRQLQYHYHQDLAPVVQLVELGGADTYAEEALRGLDVLAQVIAAHLCTVGR